MRSSVLAVLVLALLLAPGSVAEPWLQPRHDAARTGLTTDPGPERFDVAVKVDLPGLHDTDFAMGLIIAGGGVFVLTSAEANLGGAEGPRNYSESAVWRVDLDTAEVARFVDLTADEATASTMLSDGERLFVAAGNEVRAFDITTGEPAWQAPYVHGDHTDTGEPALTNCEDGAIVGDTLYLPCSQVRARHAESQTWSDAVHIVVALDRTTGTERWTWPPPGTSRSDPTVPGPAGIGDIDYAYTRPELAVFEDTVYVVSKAPRPPNAGTCMDPTDTARVRAVSPVLWALDAATGELRWWWAGDMPWLAAEPGPGIFEDAYEQVLPLPWGVVPTRDEVYVLGDELTVLDPETGCELWGSASAAYTESDADKDTAVAYDGQWLFVKRRGELRRWDPADRVWDWSVDLTTSSSYDIADAGLILAGDRIYASYDNGRAFALDRETGERVWRADVPSDSDFILADAGHTLIGVGDSVFAVSSDFGLVTVFGSTRASIDLADIRLALDTAPNEPVPLDLGPARPGAQGDDLSFLVAWGDGVTERAVVGDVLEHVYARPGTYEVLVTATNQAGQRATSLHPIVVAPPVDTPLLSAAATTLTGPWGLVVLPLIVLAGVLVGVRVQRRAHAGPFTTTLTAGHDDDEDRLGVYRRALEHALDDDGGLSDEQAVGLDALRERLGISQRDHEVILATLRDARTGAPLRVRPGSTFLGKYEVAHELGAGGQGTTYLARDTDLERQVVLKVLHPGPGSAETLLAEARSMARVHHPNVATVHEVDRIGGQVFLVMEHLAGGPLEARLGDGPLGPDDAGALATDLLGGLGAVHGAGLVHRDVKPSNVVYGSDGHAKLVDFGIVHVPGFEATVAAFHSVDAAVGTIPYMSPEQARGRGADARSDLYAAALVVYEAASGVRYWRQTAHESAVELQMRIAAAGAFDGELPTWAAGLSGWFERALHPDPDQRFATADEMLSAFREALG